MNNKLIICLFLLISYGYLYADTSDSLTINATYFSGKEFSENIAINATYFSGKEVDANLEISSTYFIGRELVLSNKNTVQETMLNMKIKLYLSDSTPNMADLFKPKRFKKSDLNYKLNNY